MALFTCKEGQPRTGPAVGDKRTVKRPVLIRKVAGEWRALGIERIDQEFGYSHATEDRLVYCWHDMAWATMTGAT